MLDESPAGSALLVSLVQQTTRHIVAVLAKEPCARSRQAVDQRKRSFVEHSLLDLPEQTFNVFVLPQHQQRPRDVLRAAAIECRKLLAGRQP